MQRAFYNTLLNVEASALTPGSFIFDGIDEYISIGDFDEYSAGDATNDSAFSVGAWVKMDDATGFQILSKYASSTVCEWNFGIQSTDYPSLEIYDNVNSVRRGRRSNTTVTSDQGSWVLFIATYDGSGGNDAEDGITLYRNTSSLTPVDIRNGTYTAMHNSTAGVGIGVGRYGYADGKIAQAFYFNKELTSTEVSEIYNSGELYDLTGHSASANLQGYWRMNTDDSATAASGVTDHSSNGNDGTATNMEAGDVDAADYPGA